MRKIKWGVMGTAYIFERDTARGMKLAENCELTAIAGRSLEKAEEFIFLEYFIVERGEMWDSILEILKRKAAQGVEVRVMYDGMCSIMLLPYSYPEKLKKLTEITVRFW